LFSKEGVLVKIRWKFTFRTPKSVICAEWEFGGLPSWLLKEENMRLRCFHQPYLDKIDACYNLLLAKFLLLLCTNGGPIIAMQIENE